MSKRTTIVLAVVAVALLAFILIYERHTLTSGEMEGREGRLLEAFVRERVTRLEIEREGSETIVLEREAGEDAEEGEVLEEWRLVEPVEAATDFDAIDSTLGALDWADARRTLEGISADDREQFGLVDPRLEATFTVADREVPIRFGGEDPQQGGVYAQLEDESVAYVVGKDVFEALDHDASWFRDKELLRGVGASRADTLVLERGDERIAFAKRDEQWHMTEPDQGYASAAALSSILGELHELTAERFVTDDPEDLSAYGLDEPAQTVHLTRERATGDETVEATVRVGRACDEGEGEVYLRVDEGPVVCVSAEAIEPLQRPVDELRERRLAAVRDDEVERIEIASGNRRLEVRREEGEWKLDSTEGPRETEMTADPQGVADFVRALRQAEARELHPADDETLRARGLTNPRVTLTLHLTSDADTERTATVALGAVDAEAAWARRGEEPVVLELDPAAVEMLSTSPLPFRERRLVRESAEAATRLLIRGATERQVLERGEEGWRVVEPEAAEADAAEARALASAVANLRAERFVAERPAPEHGLDRPRAVVEATFEPGGDVEPTTHAVHIGESTEGGAFARLADDPTVFVVDAALVELATGSLAAEAPEPGSP